MIQLHDLQFFNRWRDTEVTQNRLPHWQQSGAVYFVTWRLADSIPQELLLRHFRERETWKNQRPQPWDKDTEDAYHRIFSLRMDKWMDAGLGSCFLRNPANAEIVRRCLQNFEGERTVMLSLVVMPNHVHLVFSLHPDCRLSDVVQVWKGVSARQINLREKRRGALWQKDYFDRLVRDTEHFKNCVKYIRGNPETAGLPQGQYLLWESGIAQGIE